MASINMLEMVNVELCMIDDMRTQLEYVAAHYEAIHKTLEAKGTSEMDIKSLEDVLITNDEIKRKLMQLVSAREGGQDRIIDELKQLKEEK